MFACFFAYNHKILASIASLVDCMLSEKLQAYRFGKVKPRSDGSNLNSIRKNGGQRDYAREPIKKKRNNMADLVTTFFTDRSLVRGEEALLWDFGEEATLFYFRLREFLLDEH